MLLRVIINDYFISLSSRANDGNLYLYDREKQDRTLVVRKYKSKREGEREEEEEEREREGELVRFF